MTYRVLVTEVTNYGTLFCVAGWDIGRSEMIRPEPQGSNAHQEASRFWSAEMAGPDRILAVGNIVRFDADSPPATFAYPHATEDRVVTAAGVTVEAQVSAKKMISAVAGSVSTSLPAMFNGFQRQANGKAFVPGGTLGSSLGAIELDSSRVKFFVNEFNGSKKLRVKIQDDVASYDLGVTSDELRSLWRTSGVASLNEMCAQASLVHIRAGLARPFPEGRCYVQLNGAYIS
ncbi:hypothetical protein PSC71_06715 [Devosia sp. J2-20]|uniref:dual OB domain-containing protein n=1 Tax=Devosia sp. J2-20 TaxID=3026161 RepID=UPI00249A15AD|nr:hypothetical protein [Devosia sp. J2-20]WDR00450.1 hypothetical protein PSC71_06715 [Devosia sp. J2-20]